jgi:hypothetical protein
LQTHAVLVRAQWVGTSISPAVLTGTQTCLALRLWYRDLTYGLIFRATESTSGWMPIHGCRGRRARPP